MSLSAPPVFRPEDFPEVDERLLQTLTAGFRDLHNAMVEAPTRAVRSGSFMSASSGVTTVSVKNSLPSKPQHVTLDLRRDDLADFSAAWSWWRVLSKDQIVLKFIGLPASTRHVFTIEFF